MQFTNKNVDPNSLDSIYQTDTVYHKIAPFSFLNQDGESITNKDMEGMVYVADFFSQVALPSAQ